VAVPLLGARWVPSQVFTEITAATCVGKMALTLLLRYFRQLLLRLASLHAAWPSPAKNSKRTEGKRKKMELIKGGIG